MKALHQLHRLQSRKLEEESQELTELELRNRHLQRSLDTLGVYQREMSRVPPVGTAFSLHNRSIMHRQLGDLIEKQHDEKSTLQLSIVQQKKEVMGAFITKKSSEVMLERLRARQAMDDKRREQKVLDELALNQVRRTVHRGR